MTALISRIKMEAGWKQNQINLTIHLPMPIFNTAQLLNLLSGLLNIGTLLTAIHTFPLNWRHLLRAWISVTTTWKVGFSMRLENYRATIYPIGQQRKWMF